MVPGTCPFGQPFHVIHVKLMNIHSLPFDLFPQLSPLFQAPAHSFLSHSWQSSIEPHQTVIIQDLLKDKGEQTKSGRQTFNFPWSNKYEYEM